MKNGFLLKWRENDIFLIKTLGLYKIWLFYWKLEETLMDFVRRYRVLTIKSRYSCLLNNQKLKNFNRQKNLKCLLRQVYKKIYLKYRTHSNFLYYCSHILILIWLNPGSGPGVTETVHKSTISPKLSVQFLVLDFSCTRISKKGQVSKFGRWPTSNLYFRTV